MRSYIIRVLTYCCLFLIVSPVSFSATNLTLDLLSDATSWTISRLIYRMKAEQFDQNSPCDMEGTVSGTENDGYWSSCQNPRGSIQLRLESFKDFIPKLISIWSYTRGDAQISICFRPTPDHQPETCESIGATNTWQETIIPLNGYGLTHESVITVLSSADPSTYPMSIDLIDKIYMELESRNATTTEATVSS